VKETEALPVDADLAKLLERARHACEEAQQLMSDYKFITSWRRMRPRFSVRTAAMLDGED
jgi:hypothetical protein